MKLKKVVLIGFLIVAGIGGIKHWLDKPYCTLELLEAHTVKSQRNVLLYAIMKITPQRRELFGNDPYKMAIFVNDPDGIRSVQLTKNGKPVKLDFKAGKLPYLQEIQGDTQFGMHHYVLSVTDEKGNTAKAEAYIKVTSPGGFV